MGMFERVFGSAAEVGEGKGKASEKAFRGIEPAQLRADEKELKLGDVPGRTLDPVHAEQVYADAASNTESAIEREAKMAELRDEIAFMSTQLSRYAAQMEKLESEYAAEGLELTEKLRIAKRIDSLRDGIALGEKKRKELEEKLSALG